VTGSLRPVAAPFVAAAPAGARVRARSRAVRKRALTAGSSSRRAGAITRTSEDQVRLAGQNLRAGQMVTLRNDKLLQSCASGWR
jgi:hypothetical protein